MAFRLEWHYNANDTGSVDAIAQASFDDGQSWTVYKEGNRWHAKLGKRPIQDPISKTPRDFGALHAAKEAAEALDLRILRKRQKEAASADQTEAAASP